MGFARAGVYLFLCAVHSALLAYDLSLPDETERVEAFNLIYGEFRFFCTLFWCDQVCVEFESVHSHMEYPVAQSETIFDMVPKCTAMSLALLKFF